MWFKALADLTVAIHFAYVVFVVMAVPAIIVGGLLGWGWVRHRWFRGIHLAMILIVVLEAWAGITCPLTTWEKDFRTAAGAETYQGDFIANWMHDAMFFEVQPAVFTLCYSVFGALVILILFAVPPRWQIQSPPASTANSEN